MKMLVITKLAYFFSFLFSKHSNYYITSIRNTFLVLKCGFIERYVHVLFSTLSIHKRASVYVNNHIREALHRGNHAVVLLMCSGNPDCFNNCLQIICLVVSGVSHLDNTPKIFFRVLVRSVCWSTKQSTTMIIEPPFGTCGGVGWYKILLENDISI